MKVDVIIPGMRQTFIEQVLYSFSRNTIKPATISIVSNEISHDIVTFGLKVRIIRFTSSHYPIGHFDSALRRDIGIWNSSCSHIITFDDDQLAPVNMIETSLMLLKQQPYFWGNYRYIDFSKYSVDELIEMPPNQGRSRETPPNAWHLWQSSYGGLFGADKILVEQVGGFDLIFCGKHGGDDQNLGKRLAHTTNHTERIFVYEPPFAWHPEARILWSPPTYSNLCGSEHQFLEATLEGIAIQKCCKCPYFKPLESEWFGNNVIMSFDPGKVDIVFEEIA